MAHTHLLRAFILVTSILCLTNGQTMITLSTQDLGIIVGTHNTFYFDTTGSFTTDVTISFKAKDDGLLEVIPNATTIPSTATAQQYPIEVHAIEAGHTILRAEITPDTIDVKDVFLRVTTLHSIEIYHVSAVIGWIYFVAWSVSFYPQMYENWKRQSVVGLNFDFVALNLIGFFLYGLFNCFLYWEPSIEAEYFVRYPAGTNPVMMNDIVFALHAMFATIVTIIQCFIYERGNQKVSWVARGIMIVFAVFLFISIILAGTDVIHWLDFLYYCSYVKLSITLIKYVPQAYMNYKRKSTEGWSIGNIFLDFTGGMLSMLQMILNAHNYNDWASIFGDPTKFGLGLFSVVFDIFFIIQHYVLYRHKSGSEEKLADRKISTESVPQISNESVPQISTVQEKV